MCKVVSVCDCVACHFLWHAYMSYHVVSSAYQHLRLAAHIVVYDLIQSTPTQFRCAMTDYSSTSSSASMCHLAINDIWCMLCASMCTHAAGAANVTYCRAGM
jgi:hypothetical protein